MGANGVFDPLRKSSEAWYWYSPMIHVPTLWDAVHASHRTTASLGWPVTADNPSIDQDLPEYWRARIPGDADLLHALSTRGLPELVAPTGFKLMDLVITDPAEDETKARAAAAIYQAKRPYFFTLHLSSLDHYQHLYAELDEIFALERIDGAVAGLVAAARKVEPDLVVVVVSDHRFLIDLPIRSTCPPRFVDAGLITLNEERAEITWDAEPWISGGSAVVAARLDDEVLRAKVAALLRTLADDPNSGVGRVMDRAQIAAAGGSDDADFFVDAKIGYEFGSHLTGPLITDSANKGTHGYFPDHPEMRATLIIDGVAQKGSRRRGRHAGYRAHGGPDPPGPAAQRRRPLAADDALSRLGFAPQAGQAAQPAPEADLLQLGVGLQVAHELLGRGAPGEALGVGAGGRPVDGWGPQVQASLRPSVWLLARAPAPDPGMRSTGPGAGKAATGVPQAMASRITRPKGVGEGGEDEHVRIREVPRQILVEKRRRAGAVLKETKRTGPRAGARLRLAPWFRAGPGARKASTFFSTPRAGRAYNQTGRRAGCS